MKQPPSLVSNAIAAARPALFQKIEGRITVLFGVLLLIFYTLLCGAAKRVIAQEDAPEASDRVAMTAASDKAAGEDGQAEQLLAQGSPKPEVWMALIIASKKTDEGTPAETSPQLQPFEDQLQQIFGYDKFHIMGEKTQQLGREKQFIYLNTSQFSAGLEYLGENTIEGPGESGDATTYEFELLLYQRKQRVVESEISLTLDSPFYVRGPTWGTREISLMILLR